jgi:hypothetical protein
MTSMLAFLDLILPDEGFRCCFVQKYKKNFFFKTNGELAVFMAKTDEGGDTVYHACASYKAKTSRRQTNVAWVRTLWADVDAGPGKAYPETMAAVRAVVDACRACKLPVPLFICSGRGLHLYWPLAAALLPGEWIGYAKGLRAILHQAGLQFDPARSCDAASILRPPGTHHRKETTPLEVVQGNIVPRYELELFAHLLNANDIDHGFAEQPPYLDRQRPQYIDARIQSVLGQSIASYSNAIADRCAQLRELRDKRGNLGERLWYACLGVLAFASDGDTFAHEWSSGDPEYTRDETAKKLDQTRRLTGATTCENFHGQNPALCEACPHWQKIKSPISLGIAQPEPVAPLPAEEKVTLPSLPASFTWGKNGELLFVTEKDQQPLEHLISTYPIYIADVAQEEVQPDHSLTFTCWLPARKWFTVVVPFRVLVGPTGIAELARFGINIHSGDYLKLYVRKAVDMYYSEGRLQIRYDQYGWKNDDTAFLFGRKLYLKDDELEVPGSPELEIRNNWLGPGCNAPKHNREAFGLERWAKAANALFAKDCEPQAVALLASFASPLIRFLDVVEGGAILSLVNRESSTGKTTGLVGAYSVWGMKDGLALTVYDNRVTKFLTLAALGNLPCCHDELQMRDPNTLREFVITFTNGRDKMRGTREGGIRHAKADWQTILISASNVSLVDMLGGVTSVNAPAYRVMEMPCEIPASLRHQWGDKLKNELQWNAGYAGEVYARFLVDNVAFVRRGVEQAAEMLWARTKLDRKYRFWIRTAACIVVAGVMVRRLKLLDFSMDYITDWLINFMVRTGTKHYAMDDTEDWAAAAVADFCLEQNQNFVVLPHFAPRGKRVLPVREPKGQITGCFAVAENELLVSMRALRTYAIKNEIPLRKWLENLQDRSICSDISYRALTGGTAIPTAQTTVVTLLMAHEALAGANQNITMDVEEDESNVTPLRR